MFKTVVLTVALALSAGPSTALFCRAWCDHSKVTTPMAAGHCHDEAGTGPTNAAMGPGCVTVDPGPIEFIRREAHADAPAPTPSAVSLLASHSVLTSLVTAGSTRPDAARWRIGEPPLLTVLRI